MRRYRYSIKDITVIVLCLTWIVLCSGSVGSNGVRYAKRAACMANMKRLTNAWILCAQDNSGYIPSGIPGSGTRPWIGRQNIIEAGSLWPYCRDKRLYKCLNGKDGEIVTYVIVNTFDGTGTIRKLSDVPETTASRRMVFIDTGYLMTDTFDVYYNQHAWWDAPPVRHEQGTCTSFVDGHSEYWRWKDPRTVSSTRPPESSHAPVVPLGYNQDLIRLQIAVWGQLGYVVP